MAVGGVRGVLLRTLLLTDAARAVALAASLVVLPIRIYTLASGRWAAPLFVLFPWWAQAIVALCFAAQALAVVTGAGAVVLRRTVIASTVSAAAMAILQSVTTPAALTLWGSIVVVESWVLWRLALRRTP